jgi:hypothetical protein
MAFLFPTLCICYLLLIVLTYLQVKSEASKSLEIPKPGLSLKEIFRAGSDQPNLQLLKWSLIAALVALLSIVPLLGLPGAALISVFEFFNLVPSHKLQGDKMWPIAIIISVIVPMGWPLGILLRNVLTSYWNIHKPGIVKIFIFLWLMICLGIVHLLI